MKKLFYILTAAIVALGTVACENEVMDNITPENESLSFTATIDSSRTDLDENNMTVWSENDLVTITSGETTYNFYHQGEGVFKSTDAGVSTLKGQTGLVAWYNEGGIDSWDGKAGAQLKAEGGEFAEDGTATGFDFVVQNAFVKFYASAGVKVSCTLFSDNTKTFNVEEAGTYYVAINAGEGTLSYTIGDETVKEVTMTFAAKKIYNLGNLIAAVAQDSNGKSYTDLASAVALAESGATITLGNDVVAEKTIEVPEGKTVTLDLNGHNITTTPDNSYVLSNENGGTVTINGNGGSMTGRIYNAGGTMVINGGTFNTIVGDAYTLMNSTDGKLTVTDATVNGGSGFYGICGYNANNEVILNNVNVTGAFGALCSYGEGAKMTVNGGTYEMSGIEGTTSHIAYFATESTIVINDGTFRKIGEVSLSGVGGGGICVLGGADLTINDGTFAGDYSDVYNWGGEGTTITIKGGNYKFNPTASFIADGYKVTENANGTYTVAMTPVAALNKQIADGATNITISESFAMEADDERIVIPAGKEVTVTLEEGVEITGTFAESGSDALFNIAQGGILNIGGEGSIVLVSVKGDVSNYGQYIFENAGGVLNITGGTYNIEASGSGSASWYIPTILNNNSTLGETVTNISGGYFYSTSCINIMRQFINNSTYNATINITGGEFKGLNADKTYGIWNQNSGGSGKGYINISGTAVMNNVFVENETDAANVVVSGGTFGYEPGVVNGYYNKLTIAEGYKAVDNGDGTWMVRELNPVATVNGVGYETAEEVVAAMQQDVATIEVELLTDVAINVSDAYIAFGGASTETITINGNDKVFTWETTYWSRINTVNADAKVILNNMTLTSTQTTGTWNSYDVTFCCNAELNNVDILKAVAFEKGATLKTVTITEETHDYYAMWICANGQTITIDGLTINATNGRGIKIDEQYIDAPGKVVMNISNATFNTAKKSAIIVKSAKGAEITASNLNITNVKADTKNAVWVDEASAEYYDLVTVSNCTKALENGVAEVGDMQYLTIDAAITAADGATVTLLAGDLIVPAACQINANGKTFTTADGFLALKNYANANGYYDVVAATKDADLKLRGSWDNYNFATGYTLYNITGTTLKVAASVEFTKGATFKVGNSSWGTQYGANTIPVMDVDTKLAITNNNGADFVVTTAGTYNFYFDTAANMAYLHSVESAKQYSAASATSKTYLIPNSNWTQSSAWFAAYFFNNTTSKNKWVKMTKQSDGSYACDIPEGTWEHVIYCRMKSDNQTLGWDAKWNQTGDLYRNNVKGNTCAINANQWDCGDKVTWSTK